MTTQTTPDFQHRQPRAGIDPRFWQRWSPRAFDGLPLPPENLEIIFEAARWSPSSSNEQPWVFHTADRDTPRFTAFLELLNDGNRVWAKTASVLGFLLCRRQFLKTGAPNAWASFDCGAAWMAMTLQANQLGYHTHAMAGVKLELICQALHLDEAIFEPICAFVIGTRDEPGTLPPALQKREVPSPRKALSEIWFPG
jgi:nitroreductase